MSEIQYSNDPPTSRWPRYEVISGRPRRRDKSAKKPEKKEPNDDPMDMETKRARHLDSMAQERRSQEVGDSMVNIPISRKLKEKLQEKIKRKITNNFIAESFMDGMGKFFGIGGGPRTLRSDREKAERHCMMIHDKVAHSPGGSCSKEAFDAKYGYTPPAGPITHPNPVIGVVIPGISLGPRPPRKPPGLAPIMGPFFGDSTIGDIIDWGADNIPAWIAPGWKVAGEVRKRGREIIAGRDAGSSDPQRRKAAEDFLAAGVTKKNEKDKKETEKTHGSHIKIGKDFEEESNTLWNETKIRLGSGATDDQIAGDKEFQKKMKNLKSKAQASYHIHNVWGRELVEVKTNMTTNDTFQSQLKEKLQEKIEKDIKNKILLEFMLQGSEKMSEPNQEAGGMGVTDWLMLATMAPGALGNIAKGFKWLARTGVGRAIASRVGGIGTGGLVTTAARAGATRLATAAPPVAAAAAGAAIGTGLAYGANHAMDALDPNTWKTGGSRAKTQVDLLTGDSGTWGKVGGAVLNPGETIQSLIASSSVGPVAEHGKDLLAQDVKNANERDKKQIEQDNPNIRKGQQYEKDVDTLWNETKTRLGSGATDDEITRDKEFQKKMAELSAAAL